MLKTQPQSDPSPSPPAAPPRRPLPPPPGQFRLTEQALSVISEPVVAAFCAGGAAGAVSRTVVSPLERLKILFQVQSAGRDEYRLGVGKALGKMWREEGWRGFMRGNGTNCIRIVPYSAVQFGSYNFYKRVGYIIFLALSSWGFGLPRACAREVELGSEFRMSTSLGRRATRQLTDWMTD